MEGSCLQGAEALGRNVLPTCRATWQEGTRRINALPYSHPSISCYLPFAKCNQEPEIKHVYGTIHIRQFFWTQSGVGRNRGWIWRARWAQSISFVSASTFVILQVKNVCLQHREYLEFHPLPYCYRMMTMWSYTHPKTKIVTPTSTLYRRGWEELGRKEDKLLTETISAIVPPV